MTGKIFGVPLALILLAFVIALLVDVPLVALHAADVKRMDKMQLVLNEINVVVHVKPTVSPEPTEVTPTPKVKSGVSQPATSSGVIK